MDNMFFKLILERIKVQNMLPMLIFVSINLVLGQEVIPETVLFPGKFSPQEGLTKSVEKPYRDEICLNGRWQFQPIDLSDDYNLKNGAPLLPKPHPDMWSSTAIKIPAPWNINSFSYNFGSRPYDSYPKEWDTARMGWLKKTFTVPEKWNEKRLILHFEAISGSAQIFVNGLEVAQHFDNSLPFDVDVTDFVDRKGENLLEVGVRQASLFDVPGMFGQHTYPSGSPWTREMVGIWQDVYLRALPELRIKDAFVKPLVREGILEIELTIANSSGSVHEFSIDGDILPWVNHADTSMLNAPISNWSLGNKVASLAEVSNKIGPRTTKKIVLRKAIDKELKYWTPESPNLYALLLDVKVNNKTEDRFYQRFGWRQWGIQGKDVTLNGEVYQLLGESGHLLGVNYMTRRYAWSWYKAIKELNGNAIRLHANLRPRFYLELADEMGMAIMDESEIYASTMQINYHAPETWQRFHDHIDGIVLRDRNYPSVFGWSIANEVLSALWWKGIPRKFWPPVLDKVVALADRIEILDPTRPWISSDGDGDFHGRLPTYIYHYGKPADWNRQAPKDKPFGIGEGGSMLWGSPAVFSLYNEERSYESRKGMKEGTAIEVYWYLTEQRKISAFTSIFTIAGACFDNLQLKNITFEPFVEGQPGMQPESLPEWGHKFNPAYDTSQPFYITNPVYDAVKAAYAPGKPAPSPYDHRVKSKPLPSPPPVSQMKISFIGNPEGTFKKALESSGIAIGKKQDENFLVVDGGTVLNEEVKRTSEQIKSTLKNKGTVFLWISPENFENIEPIIPGELELIENPSSALYAHREAPETASMALKDLYFADQSDKNIVEYTLVGPLVESSKTVLESNTYGQYWFRNNENAKGAAMIVKNIDGGRMVITSLKPDVRSEKRLKLMRGLFANLGVQLNSPSKKYDTGFDGAGYLNQALYIGSFQGAQYPKIMDVEFLKDEGKTVPKEGVKVGDRKWVKTSALGSGIFDFFSLGIPGTEGSRTRTKGDVLKPEALDANNYLEVIERVSGTNPGTNSIVYLSFWIQSPKNISKDNLSMIMRSDDGAKVWVNKDLIFDEKTIYGPGMTEPKNLPIALQEGWNHIMVKIGQLDGPWLFSTRFESPEDGLVNTLKASASKPQL